MPKDELETKLKSISDRIQQKRAELEQRGILSHDHKLTQRELDARARILEKELRDEVSHRKTGEKITELERALLNWLNAVELDSR